MIKASNFSIRWVWEKHPALLISISFLLGLCFWLNYSSIYFILFTFITTLTVASKKKKISIYVTMIFSFVFGGFNSCFFLHNDIKLIEQQQGVGIFHPKTIKLQKSFFNTSHVHHGVLKYYKDIGGNEFFDIACQIYSPKGKPAPLGDCNYYLEGILEKTKSQTFIFKPTGPWMKINNTFSLAKLRYEIKSAFRSFIKKRIKDEKISDFYYGLCAGEIDNKMLSHDFAKLGLQHILAISGFHFSLIAIFCALLLNTVLPKKACSILLIILLSLYFLLLGNTPSVFRAWAAIMIHISGKLLHRKSNGLNTLGVCLLLELIFFPKNIYNLGFQFSFACTFGILLLTPSALTWVSYIFPKRTEKELQQLSKIEKIAYLATSFLRNSLALTIAVQIPALPISLYHFSSFPLISLIYNLFFPFFTGICLFTFLLACLVHMVCPMVAKMLFLSLSKITAFLLDLTNFVPNFLNFKITCVQFDLHLLVTYLGLIFLIFSMKKDNPDHLRLRQSI